jgi:hypothetical protein
MWRAEIIADTLNSATGDRITTIVAVYPRIPVHEQLLTHSMLRRNSRSSRIPSTKRFSEEPIYTPEWYLDAKRMQPGDTAPDLAVRDAETIWAMAHAYALDRANALSDRKIHREIANRLQEPFKFITAVFTSTDWPWFFRVRCSEDQPVQSPTRKIARMMLDAYVKSVPREVIPGGWHLPLITEEERDWSRTPEQWAEISSARCARVSAATFEGKFDYEADLDLFTRLTTHNEWSPLEHPCRAVPHTHLTGGYTGPYMGWESYRSMYPGSYDPSPLRPDEIAHLLGSPSGSASSGA